MKAASANGVGPAEHRVAIIGTGFSGLGMAARLKRAGIEDFVVLERAGDVGGTWRDNTYPGCQCDVASRIYSFSFAQNPGWTRTYSLQPEILEYLRGVAREEGVLPHVRFNCEALHASWDDARKHWRIETSLGTLTAKVLVAGSGPLAEPTAPDVPGLAEFEGTMFHSARWNHDHDLTGERVAVVGTGASAIQLIPRIQPQVERLHVFQRTPAWVMPHTDRPVSRLERLLYRRVPGAQRLVRTGVYLSREWLVVGLAKRRRLLRILEALGRRHLHRQVRDPELRRKLRPSYEIGCKRILMSNDYYPALAEDNVEVVTEPITQVRPRSVVTADGVEHEVDTIVLATGFKVMDPPIAERVTGREGVSLAETWSDSMEAYLGAAISGYPNFFILIGPNTGLGHNSMLLMIESQLNYVLDCLRVMERTGAAAVDVRPDVQARFNEDLQRQMEGTVWTAGSCTSWYLDRSGRNRALWPGWTWRFRQLTRRFNPDEYLLDPGEAAREQVPAAEPAAV